MRLCYAVLLRKVERPIRQCEGTVYLKEESHRIYSQMCVNSGGMYFHRRVSSASGAAEIFRRTFAL